MSQNLGTSGMSKYIDMIGFDLPRDTEKGVRHLEEQIEDNKVPTEFETRATHSVQRPTLTVMVGCINYNTHTSSSTVQVLYLSFSQTYLITFL